MATPQPQPGFPVQPSFPVKTALAIATIAAVLLVWHQFVPTPTGLDWRGLGAVAKLPEFQRHPPGKHNEAHDPQPNVAGTGESGTPQIAGPQAHPAQGPQQAGPQQGPGALLIDNAGSLDHFYAELAKLEKHAPEAGATVIHFGDSPTTADLITGDVRQQLQARFGDGGQGFNLIAKPWAWYGHRDIDESDHGWKFTTAVGFMREGNYGVGGATFDGSAGATTKYKLNGAQQGSVELAWEAAGDGGDVEVTADDHDVGLVDTSKGAAGPQFERFALPVGTKAVELKVTSGHVRLFGVLFGREQPGVTYDSIGLNGASITVLSRAMGADRMKAGFTHLHPDLVVINYGTNEAGFGAFIDKQYEGELRMAIARVRAAAPAASVLVMSPMDRGQRAGGNSIETMATIPKLVAIQERVAADTGCAFFNTFEAMGGDGTMQRWYESKPRMVGGDLIHPSPAGAKIVATAFVDQLMLGYGRYQARTGAQPAAAGKPAAAAATTKPAGR